MYRWPWYYSLHDSCGVVEWSLWLGLVVPLGFICVINWILNILLLSTFVRNIHKAVNLNDGTPFIYHSRNFVILMVSSCTFYFGWTFGLLSINQHLTDSSQSFQAAFTSITIVQGGLILFYTICSNVDAKEIWKSKLLYFRSRIVNCNNTLLTAETSSAHSTTISLNTVDSATANHLKSGEDCDINTDTNQAYKTVRSILRRESYSFTKNESYGQMSKPRNIHSDKNIDPTYDTVF